MRIDSHHSYTERYPLDHLGTILKRNRFEGSILVTAPPVPEVLPDFVKGVVVRVNDFAPAALDQLKQHPRFCGVCYRFAEEAPAGLAELERRGIPLDVVAEPAVVRRIVERFPSLRIVIDHAGPVGDLPHEAPQVFCKMGAVSREWAHQALAVFGPRRLMFGSDWPAGLPKVTWKASLAAFTQAIGAQTIEVREELLGGTAERFYGL